MKIINTIARILLAITFIFSGFVKGVDPLGFNYKFIDYFSAFGTDWANNFALVLSFVVPLLEFGIGAALILNYRIKTSSTLALLFMSFFLPFTLWIAIKNPVTDCGCFGDAIVITNWETFYKNIALFIFAIIVFYNRNKIRAKINIFFPFVGFIILMFSMGYVQFLGYNHLPILDFRPYKIGNNIIDGMNVPEGAPIDEYETEFIYQNKNTGENKEFDSSNYPWKDTINWKYVDSKSILIKEGYHAPIHDFTIENMYGEDVKDFYLYDEYNSFILIAYNLSKTNTSAQKKINQFAQEVMDQGMNFICLTSSTEDDISEFSQNFQVPYEFFFCDEITLKTIVRSNPGLLHLKEGTILNKWHWKNIPNIQKIRLD